MKAIVCTRYGPPEVLKLIQVEKPVPTSNEICIKIYASAVTSSDCFIRGFNYALRFRIPAGIALGFGKPRKPILGMVLAGEIEKVGQDVRRFKAGEQVYAFTVPRMRFGAYAEYICLQENALVALKPSNLSYAEAAAIPYGGMLALPYLRKGAILNGQTVLIYGASGAVGTCAVQLAANYFGAQVMGVCSSRNFELVSNLGASTLIDYTTEDLSERRERYDFIFDAVGKRKSSNQHFKKALKSSGKFISVDDGSPKLQMGDLLLLTDLVERGKLKPVIDHCYPLEEIVAAHHYVETGHKKGNVVIVVEHQS
ncbi:MAG: NAD(P)-dependent alcohol dehydrogenase [Anaerolineaceae bacterium]|nr:NAD(P)-dependent alcohol dehydrogenase [Anaerolineaceae bacterium]